MDQDSHQPNIKQRLQLYTRPQKSVRGQELFAQGLLAHRTHPHDKRRLTGRESGSGSQTSGIHYPECGKVSQIPTLSIKTQLPLTCQSLSLTALQTDQKYYFKIVKQIHGIRHTKNKR